MWLYKNPRSKNTISTEMLFVSAFFIRMFYSASKHVCSYGTQMLNSAFSFMYMGLKTGQKGIVFGRAEWFGVPLFCQKANSSVSD